MDVFRTRLLRYALSKNSGKNIFSDCTSRRSQLCGKIKMEFEHVSPPLIKVTIIYGCKFLRILKIVI